MEQRRSVAVPVSDHDVKGSAKWSLVEGTVVLSLRGDAPEVVIETCRAWAEKDRRGAELAALLQRRVARP